MSVVSFENIKGIKEGEQKFVKFFTLGFQSLLNFCMFMIKIVYGVVLEH